MKKTYNAPTVLVVKIKSMPIMIETSGAAGLNNGGKASEAGITTAGARRGYFWDDDDDE